MPRQRFWDSDRQRVYAHNYAKRHNLDYNNEGVKIFLRDLMRKRGHGKTPKDMINKDETSSSQNDPRKNSKSKSPTKSTKPRTKKTSRPKKKKHSQKKKSRVKKNKKITKKKTKASRPYKTKAELQTEAMQQLRDKNNMPDPWEDDDEEEIEEQTGKSGKMKPFRSWIDECKKVHDILKKDPDHEFNDARISILRYYAPNYFGWYNYFIIDAPNSPYPNAQPLGECHKDWGRKLENIKKLVMLCPRDHFKTSFLASGYIVFNLCERILYPVLNVSWDKDLASSTFISVKEALEENDAILEWYGSLIDEDRTRTQKRFYVQYQPKGTKDPAFFCTSFKSGRITGTHPKLVILDDIEDEPLSEKFMKKAKTVFGKKLFAAVPKGGQIVVMGTIKGWDKTNDVYLWLKTKVTFEYFAYEAANAMPPMEECEYWKEQVQQQDENGNLLFEYDTGNPKMETVFRVKIKDRDKYQPLYPERYSIEDLVTKRLELRDGASDDDFWSEYFLRPMNPSGKYLKVARVGYIKDTIYGSPAGLIKYCQDYKEHHQMFAWLDFGGKGAHGIAISVCCEIMGAFFVVQLKVVTDGAPAAAKLLVKYIQQYNLERWGCEGNFNQKETYAYIINKEVKEELKRIGKLNLYKSLVTINERKNKTKRINSKFTSLLGYETDPVKFFIFGGCASIEQFWDEFRAFPKIPKGALHEFDCLDTISSNAIHMISLGGGLPAAVAA